MSGKGLEAGKAFFQGVLSKITDPGQRAAAEALLANSEAMTVIGGGVLGQSEVDRQLQELATQRGELDTQKTELDQRDASLNTWHQGLTEWHGKHKELIEKTTRPNGTTVPTPVVTPPATGPAPLTQEQLDERTAQERAGFLGYQRDQNLITREHYNRFNEIVDIDPLLRHPQISNLGLIGVYELVHKDRLDKWKTDSKAAADKVIADAAVKAYQETQAQMPYVAPTGAGSGSPLDALTPAGKDGLVDSATAHYNRLQAERAAGAAR